MKIWVLLLIAVLLVFLQSRVREGYDGREPSNADQNLRRTVAVTTGVPVNDSTKIDGIINQMKLFWNEVYKPTQRIPTDAEVNTWVESKVPNSSDRAGLAGAIASWFDSSSDTDAPGRAASGSGSEWEEGPSPVCPVGTSLRTIMSDVPDGGLGGLTTPNEKCYGNQVEPYQCPSGYEPTRESGGGTVGRPCRRVGGTETVGPVCPAGMTYNVELGECETTGVDPICPGGYQYRENKCMKRRAATASTTTGGSTTSSRAPNSGGPSNRIRQVFGPQYTERGNEVSTGDGDSSQTNIYPELLGGQIDQSSRIPGVGVVPPSKNWTIANDGSLPSKTSMGSDEMARFFPFSRMPGDMDIIPDPYRVAKTFSQSSYSSKTEPTPFLTDFSAFLK